MRTCNNRLWSLLLAVVLFCSCFAIGCFDEAASFPPLDSSAEQSVKVTASQDLSAKECTPEMLRTGSFASVLEHLHRTAPERYLLQKYLSRASVIIFAVPSVCSLISLFEQTYLTGEIPLQISEFVALCLHRSDGKKKF